jgi:hypothetical protein
MVLEIRGQIYLPELNFRLEQIEDPFQDTFRWIFDLPLFTDWLQRGSGLFWINGKPGSGKSTLMKLVFESNETWELLHDWKKGSVEVKAGFFFYYRGTAIQKSFEGVLRSLVTQILTPLWDPYLRNHTGIVRDSKPLHEELTRSASKIRSLMSRQSDHVRADLTNLGAQATPRDPKEQPPAAQNGQHWETAEQSNPEICHNTFQLRTMEDIEATPLASGHHQGKGVGHTPLGQARTGRRDPELVKIETDLYRENREMDRLMEALSHLAKGFRPYDDAPETRFLTALSAEFRGNRDGLVPKLERVLGRLLDQDIIDIDLILFFDALDEFDGHLDMMSRFLKSLVINPVTSSTRVKVCLSSRPWQSLKLHFSQCPGFGLQDYTRNDIGEYTAASASKTENTHIVNLVPSIIAKANGVFIWVTLALKVLTETAKTSLDTEMVGLLQAKLQELPDDLSKFYELIIEHISKSNRHSTFALLELLIRHDGSAILASHIHQAVQVSSAATLEQAAVEFQRREPNGHNEENLMAVRIDIETWGGGLVEVIRGAGGRNFARLMHQTVLEFTMGIWFKRAVFGHLASVLNENGHSFHLKYWATLSIWQNHRLETGVIAHHAQQSELTTGRSQLLFLSSIPSQELYFITSNDANDDDMRTPNQSLLATVTSFGLDLCLKEWIAANPHGLQSITKYSTSWPLLTSVLSAAVVGNFKERRLKTLRILLENGFDIGVDHHFFGYIVGAMWYWRHSISYYNLPGPFTTIQKADITVFDLEELADLALKHGQNPDALFLFFLGATEELTCASLHISSPALATKLLGLGADPNVRDSTFRTPLDWVLDPSFLPEPARVNYKERYELCNLLVQAGGTTSAWKRHSWLRAFAEFEQAGYNTGYLREHYNIRNTQRGESPTRHSQAEGKERRQWLRKFKLTRP